MTHPFKWNDIQPSGSCQRSSAAGSAPAPAAQPPAANGSPDRPAWRVERGTVLRSISEAPGYHRLTIHAPEVARLDQPGQFVMLRTESWDPLVAGRPFDICRSHPEAGTFEVLFRVKGLGTSRLAAASPSVRLWVMGPLGKPIRLERGIGIGLVGRGAGVAPLVRIAQEAFRLGIPVRTVVSTRPGHSIGAADFGELGVAAEEVLDDGLRHVRAMLESWIRSGSVGRLYTCGSARLTRVVRDLSVEHGVEAFGFADAVMACGTGVCHGCAVKTRPAAGRLEHGDSAPLACVDGPCFPLVQLYGVDDAEPVKGSPAHA